MNLKELRAGVDTDEIDTVLLALTDMQGRLQGKRLTARHFLAEVAEHGAEGCNYLLGVDVDMATVSGYELFSWERGYGDFVLRPDLDTLRPVPWQDGTAICLADVAWDDGSDVAVSPRQFIPISAIEGVKVTTLSVAGLLGEAIKRINSNSSVTSLFEFKGGRTS